jgi:hypothetical protein
MYRVILKDQSTPIDVYLRGASVTPEVQEGKPSVFLRFVDSKGESEYGVVMLAEQAESLADRLLGVATAARRMKEL